MTNLHTTHHKLKTTEVLNIACVKKQKDIPNQVGMPFASQLTLTVILYWLLVVLTNK